MFSWQTRLSILKALLTKRSPYYIQFYINGHCNLTCRQCNIVETNSRIRAMTLEQIEQVAENLRRVGAGVVLLTGGEPFLRPDLPGIVEAFVGRGMNVRLQTAGVNVATRAMLEACYAAGARDINVSLDSLEPETSDYINGVPGSGLKALATLESISDVFRRGSAILSFGTVMSGLNYREVPAIVRFAARIGWLVSIVPAHITAEASPKGFRSYDDDFNVPPSAWPELERVVDRLIDMKRRGLPIFDSERFLRSSLGFLQGQPPAWRHQGVCDSPNLYFAIRPDGAFTTCCDYTLERPPYVFEEDFVRAFRSGEVATRRDVQDIVRNCSGCHYGSYPEATLSVRDPRAFFERVQRVLLHDPSHLARAPVQSGFADEARRLRDASSDVYPGRRWRPPELQRKIDAWAVPAERKDQLRRDRKLRVVQNRVRGAGPDVVIPAERPR